MGAVQRQFLTGCCGNMDQCCSNTITGVWYLCLAIVVMVVLISCNDLLKSRCYFAGFPWSKSRIFYIQESVVDEEFQILLVYSDTESKEQQADRPPPPPPYSAND